MLETVRPFFALLAAEIAPYLPAAAPPEKPRSEIATKREAIKRLRVSMRTLNRLLAAGRITAKKIGPRVFIAHAEIERFLSEVA